MKGAQWFAATLCMTVFLYSASPSLADDAVPAGKSGRIASVDVAGNRFIETASIMDKVRTKAGQKLDKRRISRDVRRLFATGFFSDIRVTGVVKDDGRHLTYHVKENPMIASLTLDGLHAVKEKDLKMKMKLKPGRIFNKHDLERDIRTLRRGYLKKGFYQLKVDVIRKQRDDGRVDVTLNVHEGDVTRIKRIRFIGNESVSDNDLASAIASRQSDLMAWFKDRDVFNRDRLKADRQLILQHYLNQGYLDAKVESTLVSLSSDKRSFYITFSIHEGAQYEVSSI
ncbi:MAG: POTRA domain-containing protein, partial [Mariprofundaceae bacterium]|nr:POTRA domain-containing protein [Mariprofundaceae bacterium]